MKILVFILSLTFSIASLADCNIKVKIEQPNGGDAIETEAYVCSIPGASESSSEYNKDYLSCADCKDYKKGEDPKGSDEGATHCADGKVAGKDLSTGYEYDANTKSFKAIGQ
jgi:hypothetical protein